MSAKFNRQFVTVEDVDCLPPEMRELIYDFGTYPVRECLAAGVKADRIRTLIYAIWRGAREKGQNPPRVDGRAGDRELEVALGGGGITTATGLRRFLLQNSRAIVPLTASREMIDASILAPLPRNCARERKHALRLRAAIAAEVQSMSRDG